MELLRQLQHALPSLVLDVFRLGVWLVLLMLVFIPLERRFARRPQRILRPGFATDLGYYLLNGLVPKMLLALPLSLIAAVLHHLFPSGIYAWVAEQPLLLRLTASLVIGEFGAYWGHRWSHQLPILWRFHAIHHSAQQIDWLVNCRAHPLDMVFTRLCGLIPLYLSGLAQAQPSSLDLMPVLYVIVGTLWGFFIHANVRWRFGWLELLVSTPAFHHWHHSREWPQVGNGNYAALFPWIDRLFGTLYLPKAQWPAAYGDHVVLARGLAAQLRQPFARRPNGATQRQR